MNKLKYLIVLLFLLTLLPNHSIAYHQRTSELSDKCEVYIVDVKAARKAFDSFQETGNLEEDAKALNKGTTIIGEFFTVVGEEELTTKVFSFPKSKLKITASVYYTDESLATSNGSDSILAAIVVAPQTYKNAAFAPNNAVAEINYTDKFEVIRVKKLINIQGCSYLVGLECRCSANNRKKGQS